MTDHRQDRSEVASGAGFAPDSGHANGEPRGICHVFTTPGTRINLVALRPVFRHPEVAQTDFTDLVYSGGRRKACPIRILDRICKTGRQESRR
jgi:hypothetical protein